GGVAEGEYTVSVFVNQQDTGQYTMNFVKTEQWNVVPEITPAQLESFGVNVPQIPDLKNLPAEEPILSIGSLIPQATTTLDLSL
ncbi:FimD/PapC N-terminal domain-containing protein, partial [Klebsiella pneumoniae]|uniref:FimD/PapC N-terminal domain-containing protein n=1 Tax=Klebsiella pneumoniae TaxID=573 RepID=UPI002730765C